MPGYASLLGPEATLRVIFVATAGVKYVVFASILLGWTGCCWMLLENLLRFRSRGNSAIPAALLFAVLGAAAFFLAAALPARSGYDNEHDLMCLGVRFFDLNVTRLLAFKEMSPLFTDAVSDFLTGRSIYGVLWKNRLLLPFSALLLYAGLRRFGFGRPAAGLAGVFWAFNFLALLNASAFSTAISNVFILFAAIYAAACVYDAAAVGPKEMFWALGTLMLVLCGRYEFLPPVMLLLAAVLTRAALRGILRPRLAGSVVIVVWALSFCAVAAYIRSVSPSGQVGMELTPLGNLVHALWTSNLGVLAGGSTKLFLWGAAFAALAAASWLARSGEKAAWGSTALVLSVLWAGYFSSIYRPLDLYPLHFMRHHLYFFTPFVYLIALGVEAFAGAPVVRAVDRKAKCVLAALAVGLYAAVNAGAALRLNDERRTNDVELAFLAEAQAEWGRGCRVIYPVRDHRYFLLNKYFPLWHGCGEVPEGCLLKYVSPAQSIYTGGSEGPAGYGRMTAREKASAWKALEFRHAFSTVWPGRETREAIPVVIGFFPVSISADRALISYLGEGCPFRK